MATINGGDGADTLVGGVGKDTINGFAGNDTLRAGTDALFDSLYGGAGDDVLIGRIVQSGTKAVVLDKFKEDLDAGEDTLELHAGVGVVGGTAPLKVILGANFENLDVITDSPNLAVHITGNALDNILQGDDGNNTILGGLGNDSLTGWGGTNSLDGGTGDDQYTNEYGNDTFVIAQLGDLILAGGEAAGTDTVLVAVAGSQYLNIDDSEAEAGLENVTFTGTTGVEMMGNDGDNSLVGGSGADDIAGCDGADSLNGGGGNDTLTVDDTMDAATGGDGTDLVIAVGTDYTLATGSGVEQLLMDGAGTGTGNELANTLTSDNTYLNTLVGGLGDDTLNVQEGDVATDGEGAGGKDTVFVTLEDGGTFSIGEGIDALTLIHDGEGTLTGNGNELANLITGTGTSDDALSGNEGNDTLLGNAGDDSLAGGAGIDSLFGGAGDDSYTLELAGMAIVDKIKEDAGAGSDTLALTGGEGTNLAIALAAKLANWENVDLSGLDDSFTTVTVTGNAAGNSIFGRETGAQTLSGGAGNDTIMGGGTNPERLDGGDGDDSIHTGGLFGDGVTDSLVGGLGNDTFFIDGDTVSDEGGIDEIRMLGGVELDMSLFATIENLSLFDFIAPLDSSVAGNALANKITSGAGADTVDGAGGNDTIDGGEGNDSLIGGGDNDSLVGLSGEDTLDGGAGNDTLSTDGNDSLFDSGGGTDLVISSVSHTLGAGFENLELVLNEGGLLGTGNDTTNELTSHGGEGAGVDTLDGGEGNDTFHIQWGEQEAVDSVIGGGGDEDLVRVTLDDGQSYTLGADAENLTVIHEGEGVTGIGNAGGNEITAVGGSATLLGGGGSDTIDGGDGDDSIDGQGDQDILRGNAGNDTISTTVLIDSTLNNGLPIAGDFLARGGAGIDTLKVSGGTDSSVGFALGGTDGFENIDVSGIATAVFVQVNANANTDANSMLGHAGNDEFLGQEGNDTLDGTDGGSDNLQGGGGDDHVAFWFGGGDTLGGGAGIDTVMAWGHVQFGVTPNISGFENILAMEGGVIAHGDGGNNVISSIDAFEQHNFEGKAGDDTYNVQAEDLVREDLEDDGGSGNDLVNAFLLGGESFTMGEGVERLTLTNNEAAGVTLTGIGSLDANTISGAAHTNDSLLGMDGADSLAGDGGNDTLVGGDGADTMNGGAGNDRFVSLLTDAGVMVDTVIDSGGIDTLALTSGEGEGTFTHTLQSGIEHVDASGLDGISASITGNELANHMYGSDRGDSLNGAAGDDELYGDAGDDTMNGGLGADEYVESLGNDFYVITELGDSIVVEPEDGVPGDIDTVLLMNGLHALRDISTHDFLENITFLGKGNITLTGNDLGNTLTAGAGKDSLDGGEGEDMLVGGKGDDTYRVDDPDDEVSETPDGGKKDLVISEADFYELGDNVENLQLFGGALHGGGNGLANVITGTNGNNMLAGDGGKDTLTGGAGGDTFVFRTTPTAGLRITDYHGDDDLIGIANIEFFANLFDGPGFDGPPTVTNGPNAIGEDAQFVYLASSGKLYYDSDGSGAGMKVEIALLANKPAALNSDDFVVFSGFTL